MMLTFLIFSLIFLPAHTFSLSCAKLTLCIRTLCRVPALDVLKYSLNGQFRCVAYLLEVLVQLRVFEAPGRLVSHPFRRQLPETLKASLCGSEACLEQY